MSFGALFFLALGLAMDAAAVSAARGLVTPKLNLGHAARVALFFGGFQAGMPVLGWLLGRELGEYVAAWDHWIAFTLLAAIGGKMLWEAWGGDDDAPEVDEASLWSLRVMLVLAVATSIDALAIGVMLPVLEAPLVPSVTIIGVVTAAMSVLGLHLGRRFGAMFGRRLDALGGVVLVGLGVKILVEHLLDGR
ncbi:MAG: manganese efflux pump [Sandaracinus sp.]|nr:manganese efflux pump [Sandaracinus sp.]